jgi:hypothetical protein
MKNFNSILPGSMLVCATLILFSCKKDVSEQITGQSLSIAQPGSVTECKPALLGAYSVSTYGTGAGEWLTLAQKWYENGKVKYLKAMHGGWTGTFLDPILDYMFILNWGEVSYQGNQVYLKDVWNDRMLMRVTLDEHERPVASYYNYESSPGRYTHDTTYYYYDGDRLDYLISLYEITYGATPSVGYRKYIFSYDNWGNVIKAEYPGSSRLNVQYDYTKPLQGIISNFHITSSFKLLEYLELVQLPMHHAITRTNFELIYNPNSPYEMRHAEYKDYIISNGVTRSYVYQDYDKVVTFYNGWDCGTSAAVNVTERKVTPVANLEQFNKGYPK